MIYPGFISRTALIASIVSLLYSAEPVAGQSPPSIHSCFPAGCQIGQTVEVTVSGDHLQSQVSLKCSLPDVETVALGGSRFRLTIPPDAPVGHCDIQAVSKDGISVPWTFLIGNRDELTEVEPNDAITQSQSIPLNSVINGRIDKANNVDRFMFTASAGQRVVIECHAERIDSTLRAVLEVLDTEGRRLAVNRGYFATDPLIDFQVPADGSYIISLSDLTGSENERHVYRLAVDCGPRVAFAVPCVVQRGTTSRVRLYGWNLNSNVEDNEKNGMESIEIELPASLTGPTRHLSTRLLSTQPVITAHSFAYHYPGSHAPVLIGTTDIPVTQDDFSNHSVNSAQELTVPCEVSGQLVTGDEQDWYAFTAHRGEVIHIEAFGHRLQSPVDLQISIVEASGSSSPRELATFGDEVRNLGGVFRTDHTDPVGRFVCPEDGRYLIVIRNVTGGVSTDSRRIYRLCVRREEPDVQVIAVPHESPGAAINVRHNGRFLLDLIAIRRRGLDSSIRVTASHLPPGIDFPDVWFGPGVCRTVGVISADRNAAVLSDELQLETLSDATPGVSRSVLGGAVTSPVTPYPRGRMLSRLQMAVAGEATVRITADAHQPVDHHIYGMLSPKHSPGGIVDVAVQIDRQDMTHESPVKLIGVGLPNSIRNQTVTIPPGRSLGYLSFYLPPNLPVGNYSFGIKATTTAPNADKSPQSVTIFSNPVTIEVNPPALLLTIDPFADTEVKRGEIIQLPYHVRRLNGFIGKMHTELASAGVITNVPGLRGRGVTSTGQADRASIQVEVNRDAPLGEQQFLRLFAVGVVEDEVVYHGSQFVRMEITD
ncbi:MAG: hypothetical protein MK102_08660 [Fuerstiella sp.]|nr:hypothetical protein [Fuerstiella sp.]